MKIFITIQNVRFGNPNWMNAFAEVWSSQDFKMKDMLFEGSMSACWAYVDRCEAHGGYEYTAAPTCPNMAFRCRDPGYIQKHPLLVQRHNNRSSNTNNNKTK